MRNGLGFIGNRQRNNNHVSAPRTEQSMGKYVLKDLEQTAEVFELLSLSVTGVNTPMQVRLRSTYNGAIHTFDNFWKIRPAFPNEAQAGARQGSIQFDQYWAANAHQYY